jgi:hypothetical protein
MSVLPSDIVAYGSANMPEADGGAAGPSHGAALARPNRFVQPPAGRLSAPWRGAGPSACSPPTG